MSYFVVGDIHGCAAQLRTLLGLADAREGRRLVFLGDYVDVGPDASGVLDVLVELQVHDPYAVFLQGNHDVALLRYLNDGDFVAYARGGGIPTIRSYTGDVYGDVHVELKQAMAAAHQRFLASLRSHYETEEYLFSHSGYDVDDPTDRSIEAMVLSTHPRLFAGTPSLDKTAICGHYFQYTRTPYVGTRVVCLDTGCGILRGPLTAMLLPEQEFLQVSADLVVTCSARQLN